MFFKQEKPEIDFEKYFVKIFNVFKSILKKVLQNTLTKMSQQFLHILLSMSFV